MPRLAAMFIVWLQLLAGLAGADVVVRETFDGPQTRWQLLEPGEPARVLAHECIRGGARDAAGCERIFITAMAGKSVLIACPTERLPVMDEFRARLWVRSSRPGVQLGARVVFPRSIDAATGSARTAIIRGVHSRQAGDWQSIELSGVKKLVGDQVRVLRATMAATIDEREAYIDAIVLAVPGDPQGTEMFTDALEVEGVVLPGAGGDSPTESAAAPATPRTGLGLQHELDGHDARQPAGERVRMQGTSLLVDEKPFAARGIEWNGEPFDYVAARGFNVIVLREPPSVGQLTQAEQHDLWLVCPPPKELSGASSETAAGGQAQFAPRTPQIEPVPGGYRRVLAWQLQDDAVQDDPAHFRNWAEVIRERRDLPDRPIVIAPQHEWSALGDVADIVLAQRAQDGRLSPQEFGAWLTECGRLARPGTPFWASISTQFGEGVRAQAAALSGQAIPALCVDDVQVESLVRVAVMRGCRGILFRSNSPLNAPDAPSRRRAALAELLNRELQLIAPWVAGGAVVGEAESADALATAAILSVDRARLVLASSREQGATQGEAGKEHGAAQRPASFIVPGVADSSQALVFTPTGLRPLSAKRVAGGTRIVLESADDEMAVITQDPQAIGGLRQLIARQGATTVRLERDLATQEASLAAQTSRHLAQLGLDPRGSDESLARCAAVLRQADTLLAAGQIGPAYPLVCAARRNLRQTVEEQRLAAVQRNPLSGSPLFLSNDSLVAGVQFIRGIDSYRVGENLLFGGDFENLDELTQFGWQHFNDPAAGRTTSAELSTSQPYYGRYCLQLAVGPASANGAAADSAAPLRIITPAIPTTPGQLVEISGWVRVAGGDGSRTVLEIEDSFGGHELSLTFAATSGWQPFRTVRSANSSELRIGLSMASSGRADVDAMMVRPLQLPVARRLPALAPSEAAAANR